MALTAALFSAVSCLGLSAYKQSGYTSDSFTQVGDIWFQSKIQGRGSAATAIPLFSYGFEGSPYKAGVKVVDSTGLSTNLVINSLTLTYADSKKIIFSSDHRLVSSFRRYSGSEPPKSAEAYYSIKSLVNPKDKRPIVLTATFSLQNAQGSVVRTISDTFTPRVVSDIETFSIIHD